MLCPDQILTVAQMQAAEQALIEGGQTVSSLMERAGAGAADFLWRICAGRPVTVLCGPGNNGGDGYVIARHLQARGVSVRVVAPLEPRTPAARAARAAWGGEPVARASGDVFADCLFGSGLARALDPVMERLLNDLASAHRLRVAVDLPSGVDADSGECLNSRLPHYDITLALGAWKAAHWLMPALELMGTRRLVDIGVAPVTDAMRLAARPRLSAPPVGAHKYSRGLLSVVGGAMPGAAVLAACAAQAGGAGYVRIETSRSESFPLPPDVVLRRVPLQEMFRDRRIDAVLIGPGLGRGADAYDLLVSVLKRDIPAVCDADALHLLQPPMLKGRTAPLIVTPHRGECEALNEAFGVVGEARVEETVELAEALGAVVVAKGPDTLIAAPGQPLTFMPPATSWLSTAGTGDVLAGLVASRLVTQSDDPLQAAVEACWLHGQAARLAGPAFSASQLVEHLPQAWEELL